MYCAVFILFFFMTGGLALAVILAESRTDYIVVICSMTIIAFGNLVYIIQKENKDNETK